MQQRRERPDVIGWHVTVVRSQNRPDRNRLGQREAGMEHSLWPSKPEETPRQPGHASKADRRALASQAVSLSQTSSHSSLNLQAGQPGVRCPDQLRTDRADRRFTRSCVEPRRPQGRRTARSLSANASPPGASSAGFSSFEYKIRAPMLRGKARAGQGG